MAAARSSVLSVLEEAVHVGYLKLTDKYGSYTFGQHTKGGNYVQLTVVNDAFWTRVIMYV